MADRHLSLQERKARQRHLWRIGLPLALWLLVGMGVLAWISFKGAIELNTADRMVRISAENTNWWFFFWGLCCMAYFVTVGLKCGWHVPGLKLWPCLAAVLLTRGVLMHFTLRRGAALPVSPWLYFAIHTLGMLLFLGCAIIMLQVLRCSNRQCPAGVGCLVVLGCQSQSPVLYSRADAAADYLAANPASVAICTGGQGSNESVPEARSAADRILTHGIGEERLRLEQQSRNTIQNFMNSVPLLPDDGCAVAVVTDDYHQFRAQKLARRLLKRPVYGIPVHTSMITLPHYVFKEYASYLLMQVKRLIGRDS